MPALILICSALACPPSFFAYYFVLISLRFHFTLQASFALLCSLSPFLFLIPIRNDNKVGRYHIFAFQ